MIWLVTPEERQARLGRPLFDEPQTQSIQMKMHINSFGLFEGIDDSRSAKLDPSGATHRSVTSSSDWHAEAPTPGGICLKKPVNKIWCNTLGVIAVVLSVLLTGAYAQTSVSLDELGSLAPQIISGGDFSRTVEEPTFIGEQTTLLKTLNGVQKTIEERADALDQASREFEAAASTYKASKSTRDYLVMQGKLGNYLAADKQSRLAVANTAVSARTELRDLERQIGGLGDMTAGFRQELERRNQSLQSTLSKIREDLSAIDLKDTSMEDLPLEKQRDLKLALMRHRRMQQALASVESAMDELDSGADERVQYVKYLQGLGHKLEILEVECREGVDDIEFIASIARQHLNLVSFREQIRLLMESARGVIFSDLPYSGFPRMDVPPGPDVPVDLNPSVLSPSDWEELKRIQQNDVSSAEPEVARSF